MTPDEIITAQIAALPEEQRAHLQHLFLHLVQVFSNKKLSGFFIHTLPSPEDIEYEPVLMHTVNCDMREVEQMMCNFLAARSAMDAAETSTDPTRTH
jgi:hypothetical protein